MDAPMLQENTQKLQKVIRFIMQKKTGRRLLKAHCPAGFRTPEAYLYDQLASAAFLAKSVITSLS